MKSKQRMAWVIAVTLVLASPTIVAQRADAKNECFFARSMQGWSALDKDSFLIRTSGGRYFFFKVKGLCPNLKFARLLAFKSNSTKVCGDIGEYVRVERQQCYIDRMRELDEQEYLSLKDD